MEVAQLHLVKTICSCHLEILNLFLFLEAVDTISPTTPINQLPPHIFLGQILLFQQWQPEIQPLRFVDPVMHAEPFILPLTPAVPAVCCILVKATPLLPFLSL